MVKRKRVRRPPKISVAQLVPVPAEFVYTFLADLDNRRTIGDRNVDVVRPHGIPGGRTGGEVHLRGPLGLRRIARTRVLLRHAPHAVAGRAEIGRRTAADVSWRLSARGASTRVELTIAVLSLGGLLDGVLLAVGGRWWLRWRMAVSLLRVQTALSRADAEAQVAAGPDDRLPVGNQLGLLAVEQSSSSAEQE